MATVSSSPSSAAAQYGLAQLRLQQIRRNAEQAEQIAQALQAQASAARQDANEAEEIARTTESSASKAVSNAVNAKQGLALLQSTSQNEARVSRAVDNAVVQQQSGQKPTTNAAPVVNAEGQVTGRVVNTTA